MDASTKQAKPLNGSKIAPGAVATRKLSIVTVAYNSAAVLPGLLELSRCGP